MLGDGRIVQNSDLKLRNMHRNDLEFEINAKKSFLFDYEQDEEDVFLESLTEVVSRRRIRGSWWRRQSILKRACAVLKR